MATDQSGVEDQTSEDLRHPNAASDAEVEKLLSACDAHPHKGRALRMRALILLLRYSGLRIGDAASLARNRIQDDKLELYTAKTGTKVFLPLPPKVIEALNALPVKGEYFFWSGQSKIRTVTGRWQRIHRALFVKAGLPGTHPHRFRTRSRYRSCLRTCLWSGYPSCSGIAPSVLPKGITPLGYPLAGGARAGRSGDLGADCTSPTHSISGQETSKETGTYRAREKRQALEPA
jgi:hypothetical protein